jgi:Zn-dependent M28 family amino/carboxypeptidase
MRFNLKTLAAAALCALAPAAGAQTDYAPAAARMMEHIKVLSSDAFEGRGPGTPGEEKTIAYLNDEFGKLGLQPGNPDGTYLQDVPMYGITSSTTASIDVRGKTITPAFLNDFIAISKHIDPDVEVTGSEMVFVGYGVVAPEYGWDDYKGVDVRGKTVVMLINDPPVKDPNDPSKYDDTMFKGKAMTYYGRWMYKYEEATAKGAAACLIIHETGPAGYPYAVVAGSWGRENFTLINTRRNADRVSVEGWMTLPFAKSLLAASGFDFDTLKAAAVRKDFTPVDLRAKASFSVHNTVRTVASKNFVAKLEGTDPSMKDEYVIYSAHWDHLGKNPKLKGDQIFHGAWDNGSGIAALLEIARSFTLLPASERPKRSILFIGFTAEEQGLLGAEYYGAHPLYPLVKTLANINIDGLQNVGLARDMEDVGYGNSTLDDVAIAVLKRQGRTLVPESDPEAGHYFRADHFEFAKVGVPSFYTNYGWDIIGQPAGYGKMRHDEYYSTDYHKVTDVIKPWWDLRGGAQDADMLFQMGVELAGTATWPEWKDGCEFKARRDAMMATAGH